MTARALTDADVEAIEEALARRGVRHDGGGGMDEVLTVDVMTVTYAVQVQTDGEKWRAHFGDAIAVETLPEVAVAKVLQALAERMTFAADMRQAGAR